MLKKNFYLRNSNSNDSNIIFKWSNEPYVRNNSFSKKKISKQEHHKWFKNHVGKKEKIYIFCSNNYLIGLIRFKKFYRGIKISYLISRKFRGKGYGKIMLKLFVKKIRNSNFYKKKIIYAFVFKKNIASSLVLLKAGFLYNGFKFKSHCYTNVK